MRLHPSALMSGSYAYFEELYARFQERPESVDESWRAVFLLVDDLLSVGPATSRADDGAVRAYSRQSGHIHARTDPLNGEANSPLSRLMRKDTAALLPEWSGALSAETGHIDDPDVRAWLIHRFEAHNGVHAPDDRRAAFFKLLEAEEFERFLGMKAPTKKRFGIEGGEAFLPLLQRILSQAAAAGIRDVVIASMHRGRLNMMVNVLGEEPDACFGHFLGKHPFPHDPDTPADVPYHLGLDTEFRAAGQILRISLCANPSHLEAVNPVALGRSRARQDLLRRLGQDPSRSLCVIVHTDASVIGQGGVFETVQLGQLEGFGTQGTIHVVINNQIGFTTDPADARTSLHCTGAWKAVDSAILHVNGNNPDAVLGAADIAVDFRNEVRRDAIIDLVCYRRRGHNELDEPTFTQPMLYERLGQMQSVVDLYQARLVKEGLLNEDEVRAARDQYCGRLQHAYEIAKTGRRNSPPANGGAAPVSESAKVESGIAADLISKLLKEMTETPAGFSPNKKVLRVLRQQLGAEQLSWPVAEALAFASLLHEGKDIRLTGQDVERGAFSTRHFVLHDTSTGDRLNRLQQFAAGEARFDVINSPLSENAVLGFEYGYSLERRDALTIWEAQFGDFLNCAQVIVDQFITSGRAKWAQDSGLVMLLPHGLEGQGPEHSSARIERLLQLCAGENVRLVNPSTPANYFHLLRAQVMQPRQLPLIVLAPKTLLRLPEAVSPHQDFETGQGFQPIIPDSHADPDRIERVLLCSGKLAYLLAKQRSELATGNTAIVRVEQYYPFPDAALADVLLPFAKADFVWVQEEPLNMGCWTWIDRRIEAVLRWIRAENPRAHVIARPESASPAGGFHVHHDADQETLVARAFGALPDGDQRQVGMSADRANGAHGGRKHA